MKRHILIAGLLASAIFASAQTQSTTGQNGTSTNTNTTSDPTTTQPDPFSNGTKDIPGVVKPPSPTQPTDPFGAQPKTPDATEPHNDYHLTQPSTSPVKSQTDPGQNNAAATPSDYTEINKNDIPFGLENTLQDQQYEGWQQSTIYLNRRTGEYSLDVGTGEAVKNYRFDRDGNPVQPAPEPGHNDN